MGEIFQSKGLWRQSYELNNTDDKPQKIVSASSSCDCTRVIIRDTAFGMHSFKPLDLTLTSGEKEIIEVTYDPALHGPFGKGNIQRTITLTAENATETLIKFFALVK